MSRSIETGADLAAARRELGLTCQGLARRLHLSPTKGDQAVREMESGRRDITGPVAAAVELLLQVDRARELVVRQVQEIELDNRPASDRELAAWCDVLGHLTAWPSPPFPAHQADQARH